MAEGEQQQLHPLIESICRNETPLDALPDFRRGQRLANGLKQQLEENKQHYESFKEKAFQYRHELHLKRIDDQTVSNAGRSTVGQMILLILGFPFFLYGAINHLLAAGIPALLARKMKVYIGYQATIKAMVGLLSIPLFYFLQAKVLSGYIGDRAAWIYLASLPITAWLAWKYWQLWEQFRSNAYYARLKPQEKTLLHRQRGDILAYTNEYLLSGESI